MASRTVEVGETDQTCGRLWERISLTVPGMFMDTNISGLGYRGEHKNAWTFSHLFILLRVCLFKGRGFGYARGPVWRFPGSTETKEPCQNGFGGTAPSSSSWSLRPGWHCHIYRCISGWYRWLSWKM